LEFNVPFQHKYGYIRDELLARNTQNSYSSAVAVARNFVGHQCRQSKCGSTLSVVGVSRQRWSMCHGSNRVLSFCV